jgi:hypothetical protein
MAYRIQPHLSQYGGSNSAITRTSGCTWTSGANGANASTGSRLTPDQVHLQVKRSEETNPATPGWSMADLALAMKRLRVPFANHSGDGWGAVIAYHDAGYYVVVQGDSDQFGNGTCSGAFDGDHCIGIHPQEDAAGHWLIDDPICPTHRYESSAILKRYAEKLSPRVYFGQFTKKVPGLTGHLKAAKGTYSTYKVEKGRAIKTGEMKTGGWPDARAQAFTATQSDGTGTTTLVKLLTGVHAGTILYRFAPGLEYTER